ncbi:MAG TPA: hypothetical protein VKQ28_10660 [Candidatus Acidoferrum sp.]|nr:hypothetical protein [Candidatus Acidoferrum sp.]
MEGDAISVQGPLSIEVVQGRTKTILRSGSDVRVNSGQAHISLVEGGQIAICGPAHFSVLKSVNLLTVALDSGILHAHIERQPALTIYTAQIQAKPFSISDAGQDILVGFDATGAMCIRADSGAVRVEQQLTAQSIVIPQNGEVLITDGQLQNLRSGVTHCACELQLANPPAPTTPQSEASHLPTSEQMQEADAQLARTPPTARPAGPAAPKSTAEPAEKPADKSPEKEDPVYQVYMPPLSYDANAKVQPDTFDPQLIVVVRHVRVRPTLIFQGTVKDAPTPAKISPPPPAAQPPSPPPQVQQAPPKTPQTKPSIIERIYSFFRSLFS